MTAMTPVLCVAHNESQPWLTIVTFVSRYGEIQNKIMNVGILKLMQQGSWEYS